MPLTQEELVEAADGWLGILKEKVTELSETEVAARAAEDSAEKDRLLASAATLREQRTAIADRLI